MGADNENLQVGTPASTEEQATNQQPSPENATQPEGNEEQQPKEGEEEEDDATPVGAADVIYEEVANQILEKHGQEVLDGIRGKLSNLEDLTDEDYTLIADASGKYAKEDVKAHIELKYEVAALRVKAQKEDDREAQAFIDELNEIAGGNYQDLIDYAKDNAPASKVKIWNTALATNDPETQKDVLREIAEYRTAKDPKPEPTKASDLSLLTKAAPTTTQSAKTSQQPDQNPLEGNPLAYLVSQPGGLNKLCAIKLDAKNPHRDSAIEVLKVVRPDLV